LIRFDNDFREKKLGAACGVKMQQMQPKYFFWPVAFGTEKHRKFLIDAILRWRCWSVQNATFCVMVAFSTPQGLAGPKS
jgi:hypothetical protein